MHFPDSCRNLGHKKGASERPSNRNLEQAVLFLPRSPVVPKAAAQGESRFHS